MNTPALKLANPRSRDEADQINAELFAQIAKDIQDTGFSIRPAALPEQLCSALYTHQQQLNDARYSDAGVGRRDDYLKNEFVRTDEICWINGESEAGQQWIEWTSQLKRFLNSQLFLGLFSFESHFSHYAPGAFYKRHTDAFRGDTNRVLSLVVYLNSGWQIDDGGELVIYKDDSDHEGIKVIPLYGTIVTFLSEEFPHEVLPANRDRFAIAGWFRVNNSNGNKVDPPR